MSRAYFVEFHRSGFFELQLARDKYRELSGASGMHLDLVFEYIRRQALVLSPICPHVSEHIWSLLGNESSILDAEWPEVGGINETEIRLAFLYLFHYEIKLKIFLIN